MTLKILKVTGNSMHPTLESGAFVLLWQSACLYKTSAYSNAFIYDDMPLYKRCRPSSINHYFQTRLALKVGDIVAVNHPKYGQIIKRVTTLHKEAIYQTSGESGHPKGAIYALRIAGDNKAASVNEAQMGWIQAYDVIGKVIYVFKK